MSIFDHMQRRETGNKHFNNFDRPTFSIAYDVSDSGKERTAQYGYQQEYVLTIEVYQSFWANSAQLDDALKAAKRACAAYLFSDIHRELAILDNAILSGCADQAIDCVSRIRKVITP